MTLARFLCVEAPRLPDDARLNWEILMPADIVESLSSLAERLVTLAGEDAALRADLRRLAEAVLRATDPGDGECGEGKSALPRGAPPREAQRVAEGAAGEDAVSTESGHGRESPGEALPELELGRSAPPAEPVSPSYPARWAAPDDADFPLIEQRCRLKAEGARWAATRRHRLAQGTHFATDIEPIDREIIARAKALPDCFLWMCHPSGPSPADLRLYDIVAGCFENVADVLVVLKDIQDDPELHAHDYEQALDLLAEAQSALRVAIAAIDGPHESDQLKVFNWLKATASENQIFIQRYMRADDPADPWQWTELAARIEMVDARLQETRRRAKQRRKWMGKIRHKLSLLDQEPQNAQDHWRILIETVNELVNDGLPPSNRELRELLIPVIEELPEFPTYPKGFQRVLQEIDRFMAICPTPEPTTDSPPAPEVRQVRQLLQGRALILIGGDRRRPAQQALIEAFGLSDLIWIETREHQSIDVFEPYVARADVAVVVLAIRWSSHAFGEVREFCDRHAKPLVRLPAGYSPNQLAAQILAQCSDRLAFA